MYYGLVTITTFYITHSKFQVDPHLLVLYVNNADCLFASKYSESYYPVFFWYHTVRIELTTLNLTNIKFQTLMYLLMSMYCARFGIEIVFMYRYIITTGFQNRNGINGSKSITFLRLYKFYYRRIV